MKPSNQYLLLRILIACVLGTGVFLFLPSGPAPFRIDEVSLDQPGADTASIQFADVDGNGQDEKIINQIVSGQVMMACLVSAINGSTLIQTNIPLASQRLEMDFTIGDYDHNRTKEIFLQYIRNDSLFLAIISPMDSARTEENKRIFIDTIQTIPGWKWRVHWEPGKFADMDLDGKDEYIFSVIGEYRTHYPRKLYAYDIDTKELLSSDPYGNMVNELVIFKNPDGGFPMISGFCDAKSNNQAGYEYPMTDYSAWIMVFDHHLQLVTNLRHEFPGSHGRLDVFPVTRYGVTELAGYYEPNSSVLMPIELFETKGLNEVMFTGPMERISEFKGIVMYPVDGISQSGFVSLQGSDYLVYHDDKMDPQRAINLKVPCSIFKPLDLNGDSLAEVVILLQGVNQIKIFSDKGTLLANHRFIKINIDAGAQLGTTDFHSGASAYIRNGKYLLYFNLIPNPWYYLRWLALVGLIGFFYGFSTISMWAQRRQQLRRDAIKQKMRDLELRGIANQLDPHFTFNALNVLTYLSGTGDSVGVEKFTHHFSRMLRKQLEISDKPYIKLSDELDFIRNYIELQKLRFDIPIFYEEEINSDVDQNLLIPKMLIHTHVENAIKHGILPKPGGGRIVVTAKSTNSQVILTIEDNGIGRLNGRKKSEFNTGKGLHILDQLIDLFYQLYRVRITQEFTDLKDPEGNPAGTLVRIMVPIPL